MAEQKKGECIHADHRSRMQKRVEREGLTSLAAHEVLEYLLFFAIPRKDTNALAHRLIQHFGGFCEVLEASEEQLMEVDGIGPASARLIHSFREICGKEKPVPTEQMAVNGEIEKKCFGIEQQKLLY